jgi:signal peptidase II
MQKAKSADKLKLLLFVIFLIIFDQVLKFIVRFLGFDYTFNRGISFGFLNRHTNNLVLPVFIIVIIFILTASFLKYRNGVKLRFFLSLVLAGGISNLIDRLIHGGVVDFISIFFFPVFNPADVYITLGMILFIIYYDKK